MRSSRDCLLVPGPADSSGSHQNKVEWRSLSNLEDQRFLGEKLMQICSGQRTVRTRQISPPSLHCSATE
jgi:hypothetical protein